MPIWVGKALASQPASQPATSLIGDDTGDNISHKNKSYCELTALYWMWKNLDADYYGLFHYRRFLNFNADTETDIFFNQFDEATIKKYGWSEERIREMCRQYDIITSITQYPTRQELPNHQITNYEQYALSHNARDMNIVMDIIKEKYPEMHQACLRWLHSKGIFYCNLMIMKKEYYQRYCQWLFNILEEAEKRIDISNYDDYQKRIWGFLGERLINAFLSYLKETEPQLKYRQLNGVIGQF